MLATALVTALAAALITAAAASPAAAPAEAASARALAVAERCGDLDQVAELDFTFVVEKAGAEVVRRRHLWRPAEGTVTVGVGVGAITLPWGDPLPASADDPAWATVAPWVEPAAAAEAWATFVNDQYWLLAPCKVLDPGVQHGGSGDSLTLTFAGVGLTPGDRYTLQLHPTTHAVTGWTYVLQSGRDGAFVWSDPVTVAGLRLTTRRATADGSVVVRFEDVTGRARGASDSPRP